jgi:hypothetical protein
MSRKCAVIDGIMFYQKVSSPYEDLSQESPETRDTKSFTANKGLLHNSERIFDQNHKKY